MKTKEEIAVFLTEQALLNSGSGEAIKRLMRHSKSDLAYCYEQYLRNPTHETAAMIITTHTQIVPHWVLEKQSNNHERG